MAAEIPHETFPVTGADIQPAHKALMSLVGASDGVWIRDRRQIELFVAGQSIAKVQITDDAVWVEMARDLGFAP